jgi:hypothetical protein
VLRENNIRLLALSSLLAIALFNIRDREQFPPMIGNNNRSPSRA